MKYETTVFSHQFPIVKAFVQHAVYYRVTFDAYERYQLKDEYWTATINAHGLQAVINWCMVFGSDGCNATHWKELSTSLIDDFRQKCLAFLEMTKSDWDGYWREVTSFRNEYAAHRDLHSSAPFPRLDIAFKVAHFYDGWIRDIISPDVFEEPRLCVSEERFTKEAGPLVDRLIEATKKE